MQETRIQGDTKLHGILYTMWGRSATAEGQQGMQLWAKHALAMTIAEVKLISSRLMLAVRRETSHVTILVVAYAA